MSWQGPAGCVVGSRCLVAAGGEAFGDQTLVCRTLIASLLRVWSRYVAVGDSFTEGLMDEVRPDGRHRGWADRLAQQLADLAADQGHAGIQYANLAVRGRLLPQVMSEQVPRAIALGPDLVSIAAGINDALRPGFDASALGAHLEDSVAHIRAGGADVLLVTYGDPSRRSRILGRIRDRIIALNAQTDAVAQRHGCAVLRFWGAPVMDDDRLWDADRLHLSPAGHARAAGAAAEALGLGGPGWREPLPQTRPASLVQRRSADLAWAQAHALPWVGRRLRRQSSGDVVTAKDPTWQAVAGATH